MTVRWTERASADLLGIGDYIAQDNPSAARAWVARLRLRAAKAAIAPRGGRVVPELGQENVREVFLRTYRIVYRVVDDGIVVLTIFEGHRLLGAVDTRNA